MNTLDADHERDAIDFVTSCMYSLDFLRAISEVIFSAHREQQTVGGFYDQWRRASGAPDHKVPFNLGAIVAYLYCGLLLTKELWYDLIPDEPVESAPLEWQFTDIRFSAPLQPAPTARYVLLRIRNALAHGNIHVYVPPTLRDRSRLMEEVTVRFDDTNRGKPDDTFTAEATLLTLTRLVRTLQSAVHRDVRQRLLSMP